MEKIFRNEPIRNKNCLWLPCLLTDQDEMSNRYWPIRNKNCLWWPCLLIDRDKMSKLQRGPSIDASCQVSVHLAERFQRRRLKCEKLTDNRRWTPSDGKSSYCLWQGELKRKQIFGLRSGNRMIPRNFITCILVLLGDIL